jgi:hypothetical protein
VPTSKSNKQSVIRQTTVPKDMETSNGSIYQKSHLAVGVSCSPTVLSETNCLALSELVYYKKRYKKTEHKRRIMENQKRQIESLGKTPKDVTKVLDQQVQKISNLTKRLDDRKKLEQYLCISDAQGVLSDSNRLMAQFQLLKEELAKVLVLGGSDEPPIGDLKGISADLDSLLTYVFGKDILCKPEVMPTAFPALTSYKLIQALTGASIQSWVFGSEYPTYLMGVTPLLQEYRNLIATWCTYLSSDRFPFVNAHIV